MASTKRAMRLPHLVHGNGGGGRKFVALLVAAGLLLLIINDPSGAAHVVTNIVDGLSAFVRGLRD